MIKKRVYVILLLILAVFLVVMFLLFGVDNIRQEKYEAVIIVGENTTWKYSNKNWTNITYKSSMQQLSWKKYLVFSDNKELGTYYLWHDDRWYVFDEKRNAIDVEGDLLAYSANYDLKINGFSEEDVDDTTYIDYVLEENDLGLSSQFTSLYKFEFDIDNDSVNEEFYLMSNAFAMDFSPEKTFSIAFMVKDGNVNYIYKDISTNRVYNGCKPFYNTFLDINNDNTYELILSCRKYSVGQRTDMLYQYNDNNFQILISNQ